MNGAQGFAVTTGGTATVTEAPVTIPMSLKRGAPSAFVSGRPPTWAPEKQAAVFLRDVQVLNLSGAGVLQVRVNNAGMLIPIAAGATLRLNSALVFAVSVRSATGTVDYQLIGTASA